MFSAFSLAVHVSTGSQDDVLTTQADQLGDPESGLHGEQKHGPITAPDPSGGICSVQQSIDLFAIEKFDGPAFVAFGGYCQDSLAEQRMGGFLESDVPKEGVNRGQADIASASAVLAAGFQAVEKISDKWTR